MSLGLLLVWALAGLAPMLEAPVYHAHHGNIHRHGGGGVHHTHDKGGKVPISGHVHGEHTHQHPPAPTLRFDAWQYAGTAVAHFHDAGSAPAGEPLEAHGNGLQPPKADASPKKSRSEEPPQRPRPSREEQPGPDGYYAFSSVPGAIALAMFTAMPAAALSPADRLSSAVLPALPRSPWTIRGPPARA